MSKTTYEQLNDLEETGAKVPMDDIDFIAPNEDDIEDELSRLEGVREHFEESRGENLTFGDY